MLTKAAIGTCAVNVETRVGQPSPRKFPPPDSVREGAFVSGMSAYEALVAEAEADHSAYWARLAREFIHWKTPFSKSLDDSGAPPFHLR